MAKRKQSAKKLREKLVREGKRNPELSRGIYALADLRTRQGKNKKDRSYQEKHKSRFSHEGNGDNDSFYIVDRSNAIFLSRFSYMKINILTLLLSNNHFQTERYFLRYFRSSSMFINSGACSIIFASPNSSYKLFNPCIISKRINV
ncbi:hypothetical protein [Evansella tamaricis]|uniref:hypothetical protein n=1 Tax=Evansella tamaricis TaxID=2069301 RepID=UPI001FE61162|nr:hypothetical protein [Evansella tamaricis]